MGEEFEYEIACACNRLRKVYVGFFVELPGSCAGNQLFLHVSSRATANFCSHQSVGDSQQAHATLARWLCLGTR